MELFRHRSPKDLIYLMPVQIDGEQLPKDKVRILCCDAKGDICSTVIENSVYELANSYAEELKRVHKNYAILSIEIAPGDSVPCAVVASPEQVWALGHLLEHAIKRRKTPDILKKYLKDIIQFGELKREKIKSQHEGVKDYAFTGKTPQVLHRLSYYNGEYIAAPVPIYKAQHRYPLIVLRRLSTNGQTVPNMQSLLTLDSDGDLAIIKLPLETINEAEKDFDEWKKRNKSEGCIVYSLYQDDFIISCLAISELQRRALDLIAQHFAESGHGQRPISTDAQAVLARAKEYIS